MYRPLFAFVIDEYRMKWYSLYDQYGKGQKPSWNRPLWFL